MVYPALLPLMRTPRLPVVDWSDAPANLNGLVRFPERRNLDSARVPSHSKRSLLQFHSLSQRTVLHRLRSCASFLNLQYFIFPLNLSSNCLRLLLCLPVHPLFPPITCLRRQFFLDFLKHEEGTDIWYRNNGNVVRIYAVLFPTRATFKSSCWIPLSPQKSWVPFRVWIVHHLLPR